MNTFFVIAFLAAWLLDRRARRRKARRRDLKRRILEILETVGNGVPPADCSEPGSAVLTDCRPRFAPRLVWDRDR